MSTNMKLDDDVELRFIDGREHPCAQAYKNEDAFAVFVQFSRCSSEEEQQSLTAGLIAEQVGHGMTVIEASGGLDLLLRANLLSKLSNGSYVIRRGLGGYPSHETPPKRQIGTAIEREIVERVFKVYQQEFDRGYCPLTEKRMAVGIRTFRYLIRTVDPTLALSEQHRKTETLMTLCVRNLKRSDFHNARGKHKGGKKFIEWGKHLFKDEDTIEEWLE
jgi:hypothetical protein